MTKQYLEMAMETLKLLSEDRASLREMMYALGKLQRKNGRLFILGVGGSAANASHAANDFRKLCGIEAYAPTDNVAELTARTNDEGWQSVFAEYLRVSQFSSNDALMIFSVGGGNAEKQVSVNLIHAMDYAKSVGAKIFGIVGRDGGYTKQIADICIVIPTVNEYLVTPFVESFQALLWHFLVFSPDLKITEGKWEQIALEK